MLKLDTNVWARAYLNDDASQARRARSALAEARSAMGFVSLLVLAELSWVLRSKWERERVLNTMETLLQTRGVTIESPSIVWRALAASAKARLGLPITLLLKFLSSQELARFLHSTKPSVAGPASVASSNYIDWRRGVLLVCPSSSCLSLIVLPL